MRSKDSFRVAFFLRRNVLKNGESPVFMRITVNGQRAENNIQKSILPNLWSQAKERASGTSRTAVDLNRFIEEARIKVHAIVTELQQENEPVTATVVQQRFYGINPKKKKEKTILEVIQAHN
ncbi:MAG: site-specific integrase, partial [Muribaculaceae bacterium]|nr:site-specific integrase [Muribaculaceae bacterium]